MRIFVTGATGVIGIRILPLLVRMGHEVVGMTRSQGKIQLLEEIGVRPVLCNVYDSGELERSVGRHKPDLILNELTDLPDSAEELPVFSSRNNRIRMEGVANVLAAAKKANVPRLFVQSVSWDLPGSGGEAVRYLEKSVLDYGGVVLRYGRFYGPGTFYELEKPASPRVHIDTAAEMTAKHLSTPAGIVEITE